jgi:hypothetical protein
MAVLGIPFEGCVSLRKNGKLRFYDSADSLYAGFVAGSVSTSVDYTLPTAPPTENGQVLSADTDGVMSWVYQDGGGTGETYEHRFIAVFSSGLPLNLADTTLPEDTVVFWEYKVHAHKPSLSEYLVEILHGVSYGGTHILLHRETIYEADTPTLSSSLDDSDPTRVIIDGSNSGSGTTTWTVRASLLSNPVPWI